MSGDEREFGLGQFAVDNMEIGSANSARPNTEQDLARTWRRLWQLNLAQRFASGFEEHGAHELNFYPNWIEKPTWPRVFSR
jgi:hypothetical protein